MLFSGCSIGLLCLVPLVRGLSSRLWAAIRSPTFVYTSHDGFSLHPFLFSVPSEILRVGGSTGARFPLVCLRAAMPPFRFGKAFLNASCHGIRSFVPIAFCSAEASLFFFQRLRESVPCALIAISPFFVPNALGRCLTLRPLCEPFPATMTPWSNGYSCYSSVSVFLSQSRTSS